MTKGMTQLFKTDFENWNGFNVGGGGRGRELSRQPGETQVLARAGLGEPRAALPSPLGFSADLQGPPSTVTEQSRLCADVCMNLATHTSVTEDTPGSEVLSRPRSSGCGVCARVCASVCLARVGFLVHGASGLSEEPS